MSSREVATAICRAIPNAQRAAVPGADHGLLFEKPQLVNRLVFDLPTDEQVPKLFSQRQQETSG